jgi:hypothetical protein
VITSYCSASSCSDSRDSYSRDSYSRDSYGSDSYGYSRQSSSAAAAAQNQSPMLQILATALGQSRSTLERLQVTTRHSSSACMPGTAAATAAAYVL